MKTKRSTLHKQNQPGGKSKQMSSAAVEVKSEALRSTAEEAQQKECKGVCAIDWKPLTSTR